MHFLFVHCGRINISFGWPREESVVKFVELLQEKEHREALIRAFSDCEGIEQIPEYEKDNEYALEHDEFWLEKSDDKSKLFSSIDKEINPSIRFKNIKDKLDSLRVLKN